MIQKLKYAVKIQFTEKNLIPCCWCQTRAGVRAINDQIILVDDD